MMIRDTHNWQTLLDSLAATLSQTACEGWLVGGCLRDALLGEPVGDVDVALTCEPLLVAERLAARLPLAIGRLGHGTVRLSPRAFPDTHLDLTQIHGGAISSDLARRDFTVNAMALPLSARAQWPAVLHGEAETMPNLLDPFDGLAHLRARQLVAVAPDAFTADPGRIIRAARLRARFRLRVDPETRQLARQAVPLLTTLSPDRVRDEMALLLALPGATDGVAALNDFGALSVLYPERDGAPAAHALATLRQLDRLMAADDNAVYHALRTWSASDSRRIALRLAAIQHAGESHEDAPSLRWRQALAALATESETERVHAARLLFDRAGKREDPAADALLVAAACALASGTNHGESLAARADVLVAIYLSDRERLIPPPRLTGKDLIETLGLPPGPAIGRALHAVRLAQLAGEITDSEAALALARELNDT
jgi:tRNA nucleotidyltransferase/poly(A) polymerase